MNVSVHWSGGTLVGWNSGLVELWSGGTLVWQNSGLAELWSGETLVYECNLRKGSMKNSTLQGEALTIGFIEQKR